MLLLLMSFPMIVRMIPVSSFGVLPSREGFALSTVVNEKTQGAAIDFYSAKGDFLSRRVLPTSDWVIGVTNGRGVILKTDTEFYSGFALWDGRKKDRWGAEPFQPLLLVENDALLSVSRFHLVETRQNGVEFDMGQASTYDRYALGRSGAVGIIHWHDSTVELRTLQGARIRSRFQSKLHKSAYDWSACSVADRAIAGFFLAEDDRQAEGVLHLRWGDGIGKVEPIEQVVLLISYRTGRAVALAALDHYSTAPTLNQLGADTERFSLADVSDHEIAIRCPERVWILDIKKELGQIQ